MSRGAVRCATCLVVLALAATARSEDDHVVDQAEPAPSSAEQQHQIDLGANFDANLFEQQGNGWVLRGGVNGAVLAPQGIPVDGRDRPPRQGATGGEDQQPESPTFVRARSLGEKRLERIAAACDLTDDQRRRLRLAMESDIRRFAAAVDALRAGYAGVKVNLNEPEGQKTWQRFQQDVQQCRQHLRRLFDSGSLFAASLSSTLDPGQVAGIDAEVRARRSFRWRAMVVSALAKMDDSLGLTQQQHDLVERLLLAREPPLRTDELSPEQENAHLQLNLVYLVLSGADAAPLKRSLSERQWRTLALAMNQGKSMRSWIDQQGILEPATAGDSTPVRPRAAGGRR